MKKIIAIAAIVASAQASAFFDNGNGSMNGANNANGDFVGNGTGEGEATFSMNIAAEWIVGKTGVFSMRDVLNLG